VRFDAGSRGAYSTDASNFRQVPIGVVVPRSVEAAVEAVAVCREYGAPVLSRGGGTSLAGECCNTAVVMDWSKYCDALVSVDEDAKTCVVEPGIVLDVLNRRLEPYGLEFGYEASLYGHFGHGCLHTSIPFGLYRTDGVAAYRSFLERAADLVASYGAASRASTATASSAASCCRGCSAKSCSGRFAPSRRRSTRTGG